MKRLKEKLNKNGGFTLVEMLIVVAIIAILIAVSIPLFSSNLDKAREAVDIANRRSAFGLASAKVLSENITEDKTWYYVVDDTEGNPQGDLVEKADTVTNAYKGQSQKYNGKTLTVTYTASDGKVVSQYPNS